MFEVKKNLFIKVGIERFKKLTGKMPIGMKDVLLPS